MIATRRPSNPNLGPGAHVAPDVGHPTAVGTPALSRGHLSRGHIRTGVNTSGSRVLRLRPSTKSKAKHRGGPSLDGLVPQQPCRLEPFFRNAISRDKSVHEPIVRRPEPPRRLVWVPVIGRIAAKPQAQLASAPEGSVILSLSPVSLARHLPMQPRPRSEPLRRAF